ncbi:MAG: hypothetical protein AAGF85_09375 [Bacteroidota bacterium]
MQHHLHRSSSISLLSGSFLVIVTMVLHPSGGSLQRIVDLSNMMITAHTLAIASLPLILFGFYGLSQKLSDKHKISQLALMIMGFGLIAAMFAALFNGLALPYFLGQYADRLDQEANIIRPIANFSFSVNKGLDYIFIIASCISILLYSGIIVAESKLPKWIGYFGITILLLSTLGLVTGFDFISLTGFRIFTFSLAGWILFSGVSLARSKSESAS